MDGPSGNGCFRGLHHKGESDSGTSSGMSLLRVRRHPICISGSATFSHSVRGRILRRSLAFKADDP
jgi:hypothetical protein